MRVKVRALRADLSKILNSVRESPVTIARHGEDIAVIISPQEFAELNRLRRVYTSLPHRQANRLASQA